VKNTEQRLRALGFTGHNSGQKVDKGAEFQKSRSTGGELRENLHGATIKRRFDSSNGLQWP
jgi:hypothetical protein